jgi:alanine dehydrogenase
MIIGVPREIKDNEYRVSITPGGIHHLTELGHRVWLEAGAGEGSGSADQECAEAGAKIVPLSADAWSAELVVKVKEPLPSECEFLRPDLTLFTILMDDVLPYSQSIPSLLLSASYLFRRNRSCIPGPRHAS